MEFHAAFAGILILLSFAVGPCIAELAHKNGY